MKKILLIALVLVSAVAVSQAQEIIKGTKNTDFLLKGSKKIAQVRMKDGSAILMQNKEEGMTFIMIKNGKETDMFDPSGDYTYGQTSEWDIDKDGKLEILIGTRMGPENFEVRIYKKAEFETDYKLFTTINGQDHCDFAGDNTVKIYSTDLKVAHLKFKSDGTWVTLEN